MRTEYHLVPRSSRYDLEVDGVLIRLSPHEEMLLRSLINADRSLHVTDLIDCLYADDPEGGPLTADLCVRVTMSRLRRKLARTGVGIRGEPWAGYRLTVRH